MRKITAALGLILAGLVLAPGAEAATAKAAAAGKAAKTCHTLVECLSGKTQLASLGKKKKGEAVADHPTGEDISWKEAANYTLGSIIVITKERRLYYVTSQGKARRYAIGVGREGFQWSGNSKIIAKTEWPTWRPPAAMIAREAKKGHKLPVEMAGGEGNPLGARAMYIGGTMYRIHGTNNPASIGGNVSSGCIRMMNADVIELYELVKVGARVYVR